MPFPENTSFSPIQPNLQLVWDSTSLGALKTCSQFYKYTIIDGYVPRGLAVDLAFGLIYHGALERYDHNRLAGQTHNEAIHASVLYTLTETWDAALGRPRAIEWTDKKNRLTLLRTIIWYLDEFGQNDPLKTITLANGKPAIELSFKFEIDHVAPTGEPYSLAGHLDKLATFQGQTFIVDRKTSGSTIDARFFDKFSPDNQFSLYTFAGQVVYSQRPQGLIVDGAQVAITFSRFLRAAVPRPQAVIDEWFEDTKEWIDLAAGSAQRGHWPKNEKSCLAAGSRVSMTRGKNAGKSVTLYYLWTQFHGIDVGRRWDKNLDTLILCNEDGYVSPRKIVGVYQQGVKPVFEVKTQNGRSLKGTADHKLLTSNGWKEISELRPNDTLVVWRGQKKTPGRKSYQVRKDKSGLKYHPFACASRRSVRLYRLVVEADMNNMSLNHFIMLCKFCPDEARALKFLDPAIYEVHHKNGNCQDDRLENLEALHMLDHKREHRTEIVQNIKRTEFDIVKSITAAGEEMTYDVSMEGPYYNFIANEIVVHNCGMYRGCHFRSTCSKSPSLRHSHLEATFDKRVWDPSIRRGDI